MAKTENKVETKAPEVTTDPEVTKAKKVHTFISSNKYLTVNSLGVQFVAGKATTEDLEVAKALATIDGVTLVEE